MRIFSCDLHIHTCLSPCAELDMHPSAIVKKAMEKNLDMIAICDHNSSENVEYVIRAASDKMLVVLPGMEVNSREEVHVIALFESVTALRNFQSCVYASLEGENNEDVFGVQAVVNELGEVEGFNSRLLIGATGMSLNSLIDRIHEFGGLAIASHIDREYFGVLGQLGFIPPDAAFDALEISALTGIEKARGLYPELSGYTFITSSDAHFVSDIGSSPTGFLLEAPSFAEIRLALRAEAGRRVMAGK
jgi:3',5'-nucleoside bisphosphate phosphatase